MKKDASNVYDVIVVGGGASGMMAALTASFKNKKVLLIEKNKRLGEKLKITGGGRCNITNATFDKHILLKNYGNAAPFLYSPFSQFGVKECMDFFESRGLPLKVEARNRAFPKSEKANDVVNFFLKFLKENKVEILAGQKVTKINHNKNEITSVIAGDLEYKAHSYVLATGGFSHPETGSTGDGFSYLEYLGHKVKTPSPTIVPIATTNKWIHSLAGITLPDVKITFYKDTSNSDIVKKAFTEKGNILCTHFGLSGPLILNSASKIADLLHDGIVTAKIDLYPEMDINVLDKYIQNIFNENKNKVFKNILKDILPLGTSKGIALLVNINPEKKVNSITKEERRLIVDAVKSLPVNITNLMGYDRAVIADGGVLLEEIDTKTMRSNLINNLYITGDLLNINRPSGGYSLQLCWTTGFVAGSNA